MTQIWDEEGPGPWSFEHAGYQCDIWRNPTSGILCGYVTVPKDHPWAGVRRYFDIDADCHGGLTYGRVQDDGSYKVGFDCNHGYDLAPFMSSEFRLPECMYRDLDYVTRNVKGLAEQARTTATPAHDTASEGEGRS